MQATVIDPADIGGLESALEKHKVGVYENLLVHYVLAGISVSH